MLEPRIEQLTEKKLIGKHLRMTMENNRTAELWQSFMPYRKQIEQTIGFELYSLQVYDSSMNFKHFMPQIAFEKWALVEVADFSIVPEGMDTFILESGLYAVFTHYGLNFQPTFEKIFYEWLPSSGYILDQRPHFELLGAKYRNKSSDSEEEVYIPIKQK